MARHVSGDGFQRGEGSVCLVVHRPIGSPTVPSKAVVDPFALEGA